MQALFGREDEITRLEKALSSDSAELLAVYGRRRVGKTFLVRHVFGNRGRYLEVSGLKDGDMQTQLQIFARAFQKAFYPDLEIKPPRSWQDAFRLVSAELAKGDKDTPFILFLDELPWLATPRSGLLPQLDYFWNAEWQQHSNFKAVLCGSAASWMLEKLINAKGGLYNRVTGRIHLQAFNLHEVREYLRGKGITLDEQQLVELYMSIGGIPFYLNEVERGLSAAQLISRLCFSKNGLLRDEYPRLFQSLFNHAEWHIEVFDKIAASRYGISRGDLLEKIKGGSGGRFNQRLRELEAAGFIVGFLPYRKKTKDICYRVVDEYAYFYKKWIEPALRGLVKSSRSIWPAARGTPAWRSWAGYTFEGICFKHIEQIKSVLHLDNISCETGTWRYTPKTKSDQGAQIDLLFDRADRVITVCEIKFAEQTFEIDKSYAADLERKLEVFRKRIKTKKQVWLCMITPHGIQKNYYAGKLVHNEVVLPDLFKF